MQCPKCEETKKIDRMPITLVLFVSSGCLAWIPILGWILAPIMLLLTVVYFVLSSIGKAGVSVQCKSCKHVWFVKKDIYKAFQGNIHKKELDMK